MLVADFVGGWPGDVGFGFSVMLVFGLADSPQASWADKHRRELQNSRMGLRVD